MRLTERRLCRPAGGATAEPRHLGTSAQASQPSLKPSTAAQRSLGFYSMHRPDGAKKKTARAL
jgi:hypothetical protein